jgi:phage regulator Rha-like protein
MNTEIIKQANLEEKIYLIRGQRVMLDSDLAEVYGVTTKRLKEQVRRNISRFPEDFIFELTIEETRYIESLRSQFATLDESKRGKYSKYGAFAFTEHGAVMLASVLNSEVAVKASIEVVRAFVQMRSILALHQDLANRIEELEQANVNHENDFQWIFQLLEEIYADPKYLKRKIGFIEEEKK